jgi:hypothetical protein
MGGAETSEWPYLQHRSRKKLVVVTFLERLARWFAAPKKISGLVPERHRTLPENGPFDKKRHRQSDKFRRNDRPVRD